MAGYTDDTTLDDEYEILGLDALPDDLRTIAGLHQTDQLEATEPYAERFTDFAGNAQLVALSEENEQ